MLIICVIVSLCVCVCVCVCALISSTAKPLQLSFLSRRDEHQSRMSVTQRHSWWRLLSMSEILPDLKGSFSSSANGLWCTRLRVKTSIHRPRCMRWSIPIGRDLEERYSENRSTWPDYTSSTEIECDRLERQELNHSNGIPSNAMPWWSTVPYIECNKIITFCSCNQHCMKLYLSHTNNVVFSIMYNVLCGEHSNVFLRRK